jgi:filamentous hemagglutinin family protein
MMNKSLLLISFQSLLLSPFVYLSLGTVQANAQLVPDNTLGSEQSIVNPINSQRSQIEGGAIRGTNLFHSFQEFNIQNGASVYFANPIGVENILSRVTGTNPSNIFGTLGVLGEANLFLINPNGILFGPNARLDLRGSFFASTADSIRLGENGEFSASQPNNNALLTVNPSALFINQLQIGNRQQATGNSNLSNSPLIVGEGLGVRSIINQSTAEGVGLQVQPGQTLGLISGNIIIDGGILTAEQGQIELGSVGNNSTVKLYSNTTGFQLDYSEITNFQDIQLSNGALINVSGDGGGTVQIQGQNISLTEESFILSNTLGSEQGGTLTVNAESLTLRDGSQIRANILGTGRGTDININATNIEVLGISTDQTNISGIFSDVAIGSSGTGGDLTVNTEHLKLFDGGGLGGSVFGSGQGGNITVNADRIEVFGRGLLQLETPQTSVVSQILTRGIPSGILALVQPNAIGNTGNVNVKTEQLTIRNGGMIGTINLGSGQSGNLNVNANNIEITDNAATGFPVSGLITSVISQLATGDGGDININTERLSLQNGAQVRAGTSGVGNSGDITVHASEIEISGSSGNGLFPSAILADVENLDNLFPGAMGSGNGGNIDIETDRLILQAGSRVSAETFGRGKGGNLNINATERIEATGISPDGEFVSGLFNSLAPGSSGKGGNMTINTPILRLTEGGSIGSNVFASGDGGDITINANLIEAIGSGAAESTNSQQQQVITFLGGQIPSTITTSVFPGSTGSGGDITINTQQLTLQAGASLGTGTFGAGDSGNLNIQADSIEVSGVASTGFPRSNISTTVTSATGIGKGGDLNIEAAQITLQDGGSIQAGTSGRGNSGNMMIRGGVIELSGRSADGFFASGISTSVQDLSRFIPGTIGSGNAGNITINSDRIILTEGAEISASTSGSGNAGNLFIDATDIEVRGIFSGDDLSASIAGGIKVDVMPGATGNGGNVTLNTERLILQDGGQVSTNMFGNSQGGSLEVNANEIEAVGAANGFLSALSSIVFFGSTGNARDIVVNTDRLSLRDGAEVTAAVYGSGNGGNIEVNATEIEAIGTNVTRSANSQFSQLLELFNSSVPSGIVSNVILGATGDAGNITVNTERITLRDGGQIATGTFGAGNSGNFNIQATDAIEISGVSEIGFPPSGILSSVFSPAATGQGGDGTIEAGTITLTDGGQIRAGTSGVGNSGNLTVRANDINLTGRSADGFFASGILTNVEDLSLFVPGAVGSGNAGNLTIDSDRITLTDGAEISASTFGSGNAGNIFVNARDITASGAVQLGDRVSPTGLRVDVFPGSTGNGGNLTVNTDRLILRDGGQLSTNMFSTSETVRSGNLTVNAREIEATGVGINSPSGLITNVQGGAAGSAGTLKVDAERISLQDGAAISSLIAGTGSGGNIKVNATEIEAVGVGVAEATNPIEEEVLLFLGGIYPSGILTTVLPTATGQGGNLTVNAERITLKDSGQLGAGSFGMGNSGDLTVQANEINMSGLSVNGFPPTSIFTSVLGRLASGDGGHLTIEAQRINLSNGGQIRSGTSGAGNSGNLTVIAPEINLSGISFDGRFPSSILTEVEDFSDVPPGVIGSGDGGSLRIDSNRILVEDGAAITASSFGEGAAGSMEINADVVQLNNGIISAETAIGIEGNITLNTQQLRLDNNSSITTNAMTAATGGNINITTEVAVVAEESQISANAIQGQGGNIQLNAKALFVDNNSQITATSAFGINGSVELNAFNDFSPAVVNLPSEIIDSSTLVSQNLCKPTGAEIASGSSLVISGRGGLPPNPTEPLTALQGLVEWEPAPQEQNRAEEQNPVSITESESNSTVVIQYPTQPRQPIRQAQGWVKTAEGQIILTEVAPTVTPQGVQLPHPDCSS